MSYDTNPRNEKEKKLAQCLLGSKEKGFNKILYLSYS